MKRFYLLLICASFLSFFGCHSIRVMKRDVAKITVNSPSDVVEVRADSIDIDFETVIPPKYLNKKAIMKIEPMMINGKDTVLLDPMYVAGEKVDKTDKNIAAVIPFKTGGTVKYHKRVPYKKGMNNAKMDVSYSFKMDNKYQELVQCAPNVKSKNFGEGVITTALTVKNTDNIKSAGNFDPIPIQQKGVIYFQINRSQVKDTSVKKAEFDKIRQLVNDPQYVIKNVSFTSSASPEGPLDWNTKLANDRNISSSNYILDEFKKIGFTTAYDSSFIKRTRINEDWEGLKTLLQNSDLNTKNDIISIINSNLPPDVKEKNIRKLQSWNVIKTNYLPPLRKSEVVVYGETRIRKYEELKALYDAKKLDEFNKPELLMFAYNSNDPDQKLTVYKYYNDKYPNEWIGSNNVAFAYLLKGDVDKAIEILKKLNEQYPDNSEILNNIGVCYRIKKDYSKALEYYKMAAAKGLDERNNTAITDINLGNYTEATKTFEADRCDYNKALAFTLARDYSNALKVIDCISDKSADDFYLRAIVAARQNDLDLLTTSLSRAIKLDPTIRSRAMEDYEFKKFKDKPEFQNAIK